VNNQTGTSDARAELPNPALEVRPGQFVRVIVKGAQRPNAITVPQRAVMESPQGKMVYIFADGQKQGEHIAQPRPVHGRRGGAAPTGSSPTASSPADKVIVDGLAKVFFPGAQVQMGDPNAAPPGAPGAPGKAGGSQGRRRESSAGQG